LDGFCQYQCIVSRMVGLFMMMLLLIFWVFLVVLRSIGGFSLHLDFAPFKQLLGDGFAFGFVFHLLVYFVFAYNGQFGNLIILWEI
jgi:hypothetical protein